MAVVSDMLRAPGDMARDGTLLTGWTALADFVNLAGAKDHAPALLDFLRPISSTVVGNGVNWNESVALRVGQPEALLGEWALAEASFDLADDIARRMRAPLGRRSRQQNGPGCMRGGDSWGTATEPSN